MARKRRHYAPIILMRRRQAWWRKVLALMSPEFLEIWWSGGGFGAFGQHY